MVDLPESPGPTSAAVSPILRQSNAAIPRNRSISSRRTRILTASIPHIVAHNGCAVHVHTAPWATTRPRQVRTVVHFNGRRVPWNEQADPQLPNRRSGGGPRRLSAARVLRGRADSEAGCQAPGGRGPPPRHDLGTTSAGVTGRSRCSAPRHGTAGWWRGWDSHGAERSADPRPGTTRRGPRSLTRRRKGGASASCGRTRPRPPGRRRCS
jgi:hypothetical protein